MDFLQEQQQPPSPPPLPPQPAAYPPPAYGQMQTYGQAPAQSYAPAYAAPAPRRNVFTRTTRLLLRRVVHGGMLLGAWVRPRLGWVLLTLLLLGVIVAQSLFLIAPRVFGSTIPDKRVTNLVPASAVESFIQGQREFNAEMMWNAFSPRFQAMLLDRGASKETLQVQVENEKSSGQRYSNYSYIGGKELGDGSTMFFYLVDVQSPRADRNGPISYIFTVDRDGKIIRVE